MFKISTEPRTSITYLVHFSGVLVRQTITIGMFKM